MMANVLKQHVAKEHLKLQGLAHNNLSAIAKIHEINSLHKLLLPFTVDPHGLLGPLASEFLFGSTHPFANITRPLHHGGHEPSRVALANLSHDHFQRNILARADHNW
jgi:hypothetical protein